MTPNEFKLICIDKRYRQCDIAQALGVSSGLVSHWWTGRTRIAERYHRDLRTLPENPSPPKKQEVNRGWEGVLDGEQGVSPLIVFRGVAGYTQQELARLFHVAQGQISRWELCGAAIPGIVRAAVEQATLARRYFEMLSEEQKAYAVSLLSAPPTKETGADNPFL